MFDLSLVDEPVRLMRQTVGRGSSADIAKRL
jgi:hypothetical protein